MKRVRRFYVARALVIAGIGAVLMLGLQGLGVMFYNAYLSPAWEQDLGLALYFGSFAALVAALAWGLWPSGDWQRPRGARFTQGERRQTLLDARASWRTGLDRQAEIIAKALALGRTKGYSNFEVVIGDRFLLQVDMPSRRRRIWCFLGFCLLGSSRLELIVMHYVGIEVTDRSQDMHAELRWFGGEPLVYVPNPGAGGALTRKVGLGDAQYRDLTDWLGVKPGRDASVVHISEIQSRRHGPRRT